MQDMLIFDLDGTISDPKEGIVKSFNYALQHFGFEPKKEKEIVKLIGPPLDKAFESLTGADDVRLTTSLIAKYRERYGDVGYAENVLYEGIQESLQTLHQQHNLRLAVCTSKRTDFATKILQRFNLLALFDFVDGGDVGIDKGQQLSALLEKGAISQQSVMIGDRYVDLKAANANNLTAAGVLWGYGSQQEIQKYEPRYLLSCPSDLLLLTNA